jgi:hypothetical protein
MGLDHRDRSHGGAGGHGAELKERECHGRREQDTWISLATTLLTPAEIVRAKQFGCL